MNSVEMTDPFLIAQKRFKDESVRRCSSWIENMEFDLAPLKSVPLTEPLPGYSNVIGLPIFQIPPTFRLLAGQTIKRLQFVGRSDSNTMCLPEFLEKQLKPNQLSALLCARWAEHLAEWRIAQLTRSDPDWWKEQRNFINIRLHRATIEMLLYRQVVASSGIDDTSTLPGGSLSDVVVDALPSPERLELNRQDASASGPLFQ